MFYATLLVCLTVDSLFLFKIAIHFLPKKELNLTRQNKNKKQQQQEKPQPTTIKNPQKPKFNVNTEKHQI